MRKGLQGMAKHGKSDTTKSGSGATQKRVKKSASRAKLASPSKAQDAGNEKKPAAQKPDRRRIVMTVVVIVFAVLMAVSLMLPSLAQVFSSNTERQRAEEEAAAAAAAAAQGSGSSASTSYDLSSVDGIMQAYSTSIAEQEAKVAEDPENLAHLLNCGQVYMTCGYNAAQYVTSDSDGEKVISCFKSAENYFDQYLALKDSSAVKVNHGLCELYQGNVYIALNNQDAALTHVQQAITELKQVTSDDPDYGPGWANLGLAYEAIGDNESAVAAYGKAQQADPNDEYGSRSFATTRISQIESQQQAESTTTDSDESTGVSALWNDLSK